MENLYNTPQQIVEANLEASEAKTKKPILKLLVSGLLAGAAISFGGISSSVAVHAIGNMVRYGQFFSQFLHLFWVVTSIV